MTDIIRHTLMLPNSNNIPGKDDNITNILTRLMPHMLTIDGKVRSATKTEMDVAAVTDLKVECEPTITPDTNICKLEPITPAQHDSLFWCIYIAIHKYEEYLMVHHKHNGIEMEWKHKLSNQVTECPAKLKLSNHKVTKANIQEILSDFMTSPYKTNQLCVVAVTVYHNINIIIMNSTHNMRMEFLSGSSTNDTYIINKNERNHYSINTQAASVAELENIRNHSFLIENNEKPLKSIGTYKVDELIEYAKLFGLHNDHEKYKKNELYDLVGNYVAKNNILI